MYDEYEAYAAMQANQPIPFEPKPLAIAIKERDPKWSTRQCTIFDAIEQTNDNLLISAVAGSGKTTTIVEGIKLTTGNSIFLAFNKAIAEELKLRGVNARTFHSLTYSVVTRFLGIRQIDSDKLRKLCSRNLKGDDNFIYASFICRLVGIGKQCGIGVLIDQTDTNWMRIINHYDLELDNEKGNIDTAIELAHDLLKWSNEDNSADFDDLLYLPVLRGMTLAKYDTIFLDEAQDTNAIQRALLKKIMHKNSRLVAVGDRAQAIYGFRGSDSDSLDLIKNEFRCRELPLDITYRCAKSIVKQAQKYVPEITAADTAGEGEVKNLGNGWELDSFLPQDLIVCRTTKPLISMALKFLKVRKPAFIMGREIGDSLKSTVNKMKASDVDGMLDKLEVYTEREYQKAIAKGQEGKAESIYDKRDAIEALANSLPEGERTLYTLLNIIDEIFRNKGDAVVLATIHKSKGLEAERVFWLNASKCPASWVKLQWQKVQEDNLCYVAITRAKNYLALIEEK